MNPLKRRRWLLVKRSICLMPAPFASSIFGGTAFAQTTANTTVGSGNWNASATWSGGTVPNNAGLTRYNINVNSIGNATVLLNTNATVNQLSIGNGSTLNVDPARTLTIVQNGDVGSGILNNNGAINLNGTTSNSALSFAGVSNGPMKSLGRRF